MRPEDLDYALPEALIAQAPAPQRAASRMMIVDRRQGADQPFEERRAGELAEVLGSLYARPPLVVVNDSKVVPARVYLQHRSGREMELLVCAPSPSQVAGQYCSAWVRRAKRLKVGDELRAGALVLRYEGPDEIDPRARRFLIVQGRVLDLLHTQGELPLPPYIQRPEGPGSQDLQRYQTVYAQQEGSVAAPTAGLHLDQEVLGNIDCAAVTLHVGPGTFLPMEVQDVREHRVGSERVEISQEACSKIREAKAAGRPILAVGTTVTRCLEGVHRAQGELKAGSQSVDLVITPGFEFKVVDALLTNFHLPKSSLLMLTCAFGGQERILSAYRRAVEREFRFYSYGDCMLIASSRSAE